MTRREGLGLDQEYLREHQYRDPTNLNARIALHAKYSRADEPWYPWLAGRIEWPEGGHVLEVGCGSGALWVDIAPLLPDLRLTLTDLSPGMVEAAAAAVAALDGIELSDARTCDVQELPFADEAFDVVVANHMLYHVPDPARAAAEIARVLRPDGVLMAATNGPRHLDAVADLSRQVLGWSSLDSVDRRFGSTNGASVLGTAFRSVAWQHHPATMVCTDPDDVFAFIASSAAGQEASPGQRRALQGAVAARFRDGGGVLPVTTESGCFQAREPRGGQVAG
ncbi:MAG: class I SAM-dependent methyltransferase [Acidimicrobiales bacterium]|jgi:SAM-dependent methyltransferase